MAPAVRGSPVGKLAVSREPYRDAYTLPITATASVPPSSRVESLTADPTPASRREIAPMMDSVAGAEVRPMPSPYSSHLASSLSPDLVLDGPPRLILGLLSAHFTPAQAADLGLKITGDPAILRRP